MFEVKTKKVTWSFGEMNDQPAAIACIGGVRKYGIILRDEVEAAHHGMLDEFKNWMKKPF